MGMLGFPVRDPIYLTDAEMKK